MKNTDRMFYLVQASCILPLLLAIWWGLEGACWGLGVVAVVLTCWEITWQREFKRATRHFEEEMAAFYTKLGVPRYGAKVILFPPRDEDAPK